LADSDLSHLEVPASVEGITAKWLQQVLQPHFYHTAVQHLVSERIGEEYGLASEIYRIRWDSNRTPHSIVAKLWDTAGPAGTREVDFYQTFAKLLKPGVPSCYHAAIDPEHARGILILEDLGTVTQGDCLRQLPLSLARAVARNLAGIHASLLENETLYQGSWLPSLSTWERDPDWYASRRAAFLERFSDRLNGRARTLLDRFELAQLVGNDRLASAPVTLIHGDYHLDNYVFVGGTVPVLLDWARCGRGPFALDLYELLFSMSDASDREQVYEAYSAEFAANSGKTLDHEEIWRQLGAAFLRNFALATFGVALWQPVSPREVAMIDVGLSRTLRALGYWSSQDPTLFRFLK
jgi:aminoglycoside/choline kinase family phosphotransferase